MSVLGEELLIPWISRGCPAKFKCTVSIALTVFYMSLR